MPKLSHSFNVMLTPEQVDALRKLADSNQCSVAALIRQATNIYVNSVAYGQPLCANGARCQMVAAPSASHVLRTAPGMLPQAFQQSPVGS